MINQDKDHTIEELISAIEEHRDIEEIRQIISGIEDMLAAGAEVNSTDQDGATPLWLAAQNGHTETAQLLISAGADVNQAVDKGSNAFIYCSTKWSYRSSSTIKAISSRGQCK